MSNKATSSVGRELLISLGPGNSLILRICIALAGLLALVCSLSAAVVVLVSGLSYTTHITELKQAIVGNAVNGLVPLVAVMIAVSVFGIAYLADWLLLRLVRGHASAALWYIFLIWITYEFLLNLSPGIFDSWIATTVLILATGLFGVGFFTLRHKGNK